MFVIGYGKRGFKFIRVKIGPVYTPTDVRFAVLSVTYNVMYYEASIFKDYSEAQRILTQIKDRKDEIYFYNDDALSQAVDGVEMDVNNLKIYELRPFEIDEHVCV